MMANRFSNFIFNIRLKCMWLSHTHTFNWAHKPLCERFKPGVLHIGKLHVCRSCVFAYSGILIGVIASVVYPTLTANMKLTWLLLFLVPVVVSSYPRIYKKLQRVVQDVLRLVMGVLIGFIPFLLLHRNFLCGITCIVVMGVFWRIYFHQRKIRKLHACDGCPELNLPDICSGFQHQSEAIRLYEIEATDLLYRTGRGFPK